MIGDWVVVERAGEVIPQIVSAITERRTGDERPFEMPDRCPSCGEAVTRPDGEAMSYCVNAACPAQLVRLLEHFVGRGAMAIEGMGGKTGIALIDHGLVADVADIYYLDAESIVAIDRMGEKSVSNLLSAIDASKDRPLARLLVAPRHRTRRLGGRRSPCAPVLLDGRPGERDRGRADRDTGNRPQDSGQPSPPT